MTRKRLLVVLVLLWSLAAILPAVAAPWNNLFSRVDTDPEKPYKLTQENGPWLIMAASFSGEHAEEQAHELVLEIRKRFRVNAYVFNKVFDYSHEMEGQGFNRFGEQRQVQYRRAALDRFQGGDGKFKELAVMVGDYPEVDDPAAQKLLKTLKYAEIECLKPAEGRHDSRNLAFLREMQREINRRVGHEEAARKGPLGMAFMTTNPMLPDEYFVPKGLEKIVVQMNEPVKYSLLKCPGKYSVKVATFTGQSVIDPKKIKQIEAGGGPSMKLADAAQKAHDLTMALRAKGYEAYEFHDRYASIVTVGSFDTLGNRLPDGKIAANPQIKAVIENFGPEQIHMPNGSVAMGQPRQIKSLGIRFDIQPQLVEVPQQSIAADYERTAWRTR